LIALFEAEKEAIAQWRQDTTLDLQHVILHLGLISWFGDTSREDRYAVVAGHLVVTGVDLGFVVASLRDAGLEIVRDEIELDPLKWTE